MKKSLSLSLEPLRRMAYPTISTDFYDKSSLPIRTSNYNIFRV